MKERIIVACDTDDEDTLKDIVLSLVEYVGYFKIGLEAIHSPRLGPIKAMAIVKLYGGKVMYDAKLYDIPNTMKGAIRGIDDHKAEYFTFHAPLGPDGLAQTFKDPSFHIASGGLGVTVLTSIKSEACVEIFGASSDVVVPKFAGWLADAGAAGIVCSPREAARLRKLPALDALEIVTPGIRPDWWTLPPGDDQARALTPREAILNGADKIVVGRPILKPYHGSPITDPTHYRVEAAKRVAEEISRALQEKKRPT